MTPRLRIYLELERVLFLVEADNETAAEALRDAMDPIWYSMTEDERRVLDDRAVGRLASLEVIRVPADQVFGAPPGPVARRTLPPEPIKDWLVAA
jgi:hypothetical protein